MSAVDLRSKRLVHEIPLELTRSGTVAPFNFPISWSASVGTGSLPYGTMRPDPITDVTKPAVVTTVKNDNTSQPFGASNVGDIVNRHLHGRLKRTDTEPEVLSQHEEKRRVTGVPRSRALKVHISRNPKRKRGKTRVATQPR